MRQETFILRRPAARGRQGLVAAQHLAAAEIGAEVLRAGGHAVDAAIATSFALAVLEPWMSGPGGGGFLVIAPRGGPVQVVDGGMVAPGALDPAAFPLDPAAGRDLDLFGWPRVSDDRNVLGPLAVAVPGLVDGLGLAHQRFGRLPWRELLAPAVTLAERGLPLSWFACLKIQLSARELARVPTGREVYLPDGLPPVPEQAHLPLPHLAGTLERLAAAGPRDLYEGEVGRALVRDVQAAGGVLAGEDLARYRARLVDPLGVDYAGHQIRVPAGLTAGPTLTDALARIAGRIPRGSPGPEAFVAWAEALMAAYEARLGTLGDVDDRRDPASTTHLVVQDGDGTMVSLTQTLLSGFGSKLVSPATGILLNNGIMWFDPRPGRPNAIGPGRRPLSNMCPVVALRDGVPVLALGGSGGRKIMPAVLQLISMMLDGGIAPEDAFHAPRIDVSGEPFVTADIRLPEEVIRALEARFRVVPAESLVSPSSFTVPTGIALDASGEARGLTHPELPVAGAAAA